jgi:hypothetical protein
MPIAGKGHIMGADHLIKTAWFYREEVEKNRLNWFLFEYACKLYEYVNESRNKTVAKWRLKRSGEQLADFCAYFAKRMRSNVHRHLYKGQDGHIVDEVYIFDYCHTNKQRETDAILKVCEAAWLDHLKVCSVCPVACLDEMTLPSEFFDRIERGGYLQ